MNSYFCQVLCSVLLLLLVSLCSLNNNNFFVNGFATTSQNNAQNNRLSSMVLSMADNSEASAQSAATATGNNQKEYGKSLDIPDTYVRCGRCQSHYAIKEEDLSGNGKRLECTLCGHSWFQSRDRLMTIRDGYELTPLPESDVQRVQLNLKENKHPNFMGDIKLYIANISFKPDIEEVLLKEFQECGMVGDLSLAKDQNTGRYRGFGFVTMRTKEDGQKAIDMLDGKEIAGRPLTVRESNN